MVIVCDVGIVGVLKQVLRVCYFMGHKGVFGDKGDRTGLYDKTQKDYEKSLCPGAFDFFVFSHNNTPNQIFPFGSALLSRVNMLMSIRACHLDALALASF